MGDPDRLRQVLLNLLSNSLKFTPSDGQVSVRLRCKNLETSDQQQAHSSSCPTHSLSAETSQKLYLSVEIHDTGLGISQKAQQRLFQPFAQADSSTTRQFGGTGLGLAISKKLVELMGGSITVQSQIGVGSVFVFHVKVGQMDSVANELAVGQNISQHTQVEPDNTLSPCDIEENLSSAASDAKVKANKPCILVVEDNAVTQKIVRIMLQRLECEVYVACNGAEAVSVVRNHDSSLFHLVLMDCEMPFVIMHLHTHTHTLSATSSLRHGLTHSMGFVCMYVCLSLCVCVLYTNMRVLA